MWSMIKTDRVVTFSVFIIIYLLSFKLGCFFKERKFGFKFNERERKSKPKPSTNVLGLCHEDKSQCNKNKTKTKQYIN